MLNYTAESYGDAIAAVFDAVNDDPVQVAGIVDFLREHAGGGPVLEAGIGTGRIGLPLSEALAGTGVAVYGVDISEEMVGQLRGKPGADRLTVQVGNMLEVDFGVEFSLVYLAQGTFGALATRELQQRYLARVREQLAPGGRVAVETMEIDESRFSHDQYVTTSLLDVGHVVLSAAMREPDAQLLSIQNILLTPHGIQLYPVKFRYYTAVELDDMATEAGLTLVRRYADWDRTEYMPGDLRHISLYERKD